MYNDSISKKIFFFCCLKKIKDKTFDLGVKLLI